MKIVIPAPVQILGLQLVQELVALESRRKINVKLVSLDTFYLMVNVLIRRQRVLKVAQHGLMDVISAHVLMVQLMLVLKWHVCRMKIQNV